MKELRDILELEHILYVAEAEKRADAVAQLNNLFGLLDCQQLPRFQMRIADVVGVRVTALTMFGVDGGWPYRPIDDLLGGTNVVEETENSSLRLKRKLRFGKFVLDEEG